jgi:uncharacterized membrane protein YoaK (UPF0700 family)
VIACRHDLGSGCDPGIVLTERIRASPFRIEDSAVAPSPHRTNYESRSLALAVCLAALAGYVDALGFLFMRGLYVSFMSDNSTRLSTELGRADWHAAATTAGLIGAFVFGVILGQLIAARNVALDLAAVGTLLAAAGGLYWLGFSSSVPVLMAMAMGMENCALERAGDVTLSLTYVTGTLVKLGRGLAAAWQGQDLLGWFPYLLLWCGFSLGGVTGAVVFGTWRLDGVWFASGAAFLLVPASLWLCRPRPVQVSQ